MWAAWARFVASLCLCLETAIHSSSRRKQARQSVLEPYAGASPFAHAGQRVVVGQRLMQAAGDPFLGWYTGSRAL